MEPAEHPLSEIALAISGFRSDAAVSALLRAAFAPGQPRFGAVIVVDSLGSGAIARAAMENGWTIDYHGSDRNLGSAGNLAKRLTIAADAGLKWCFAVNHDGAVDPAKVQALACHGASRPRVGAVYPQLIFERANNRLDAPRRGFSTYGVLRDDDGQPQSCSEVAWSSSNGALYNLDAVRDGIHLWPELWMGYEDLALGWELRQRGWTQYLCSDVTTIDNYEFGAVRILGRQIQLAAKPSWYNYYQLRNLALIARRTRGGAVSWGSIALRLAIDLALILLFRNAKIERITLLLKGLRDGLRNISGKGPVP